MKDPTMIITERDACVFASLIPQLKKTAKKMAIAERELGHIAGANEFENYVEELDKRLKDAANTPEFKAKFEERMKRVKGKE